MARGSQPENGNCADLPMAESRNSSAISVASPVVSAETLLNAENRAEPSSSKVVAVASSRPASANR